MNHICTSYIKKSNGPKFADPSMADDCPIFKRSMILCILISETERYSRQFNTFILRFFKRDAPKAPLVRRPEHHERTTGLLTEKPMTSCRLLPGNMLGHLYYKRSWTVGTVTALGPTQRIEAGQCNR